MEDDQTNKPNKIVATDKTPRPSRGRGRGTSTFRGTGRAGSSLGHKRRRESQPGGCQICLASGHNWRDCFYLFPEKCSYSWTGNSIVKKFLPNILEDHPAIKEEYDRLRKTQDKSA